MILLMLFLHIVDDYYMQGILASMKQKKFWKDNAPEKMYKYDFIWALLTHSFSWSFMIMLPIAFMKGFNINNLFLVVFVGNTIIHAVVDDLKANRLKINLWQDQIIHICQIIITAKIFL